MKASTKQNRTMVELMCQCEFISISPSTTWEFLKVLAEKTMKWKIIRDESLNSSYDGAKGGMHVVSDVSHPESSFVALET